MAAAMYPATLGEDKENTHLFLQKYIKSDLVQDYNFLVSL